MSVSSAVWNSIGFASGIGNSEISTHYNYSDKDLKSGKYRYRLKQIDFNGNWEYFDLENEITIGLPQQFFLSPNYPNPFNPQTKIDFEIPFGGNVRLNIFDMNGKEVMTLLDESREPGYYSVVLDAASLSSGIYFCRMQSGNFVMTRKMMLIK
jgi:hypothetical protein